MSKLFNNLDPIEHRIEIIHICDPCRIDRNENYDHGRRDCMSKYQFQGDGRSETDYEYQ